MKKGDPERDPKGLILESYRIDGISPGECRSIFLDWALSLPVGADTPTALRGLLAEYEVSHPGHPMKGLCILFRGYYMLIGGSGVESG